jgi:hypothetical protein
MGVGFPSKPPVKQNPYTAVNIKGEIINLSAVPIVAHDIPVIVAVYD